jgi:hypothetical protein
VDVAQLVELLVVVQAVAGSSPVVHLQGKPRSGGVFCCPTFSAKRGRGPKRGLLRAAVQPIPPRLHRPEQRKEFMDTQKALRSARQQISYGQVRVGGIDPVGQPHTRGRTLDRLDSLIEGQRAIDALVAEVESFDRWPDDQLRWTELAVAA